MGLIFPSQEVDIEWQHKQNRGRRREPRQEFSSLVNNYTVLGIELIGDKVGVLVKAANFWLFRCALYVP
jgi:hypothetical protein